MSKSRLFLLALKLTGLEIARWLLGRGTEQVGLVLGNDTSGKTTLICRLRYGEPVQTIPTIGFNVETFEYPDGDKLTLWDIGGGLLPCAVNLTNNSRMR
jgi:ubiquitin carboxyl-terminal hydrolase L3